MQQTDIQLTTEANVIGNETVAGANTADRVRDMLINIIDSKPNNTATQAALDLKADLYRSINTQTTDYTFVLSDAGKWVQQTSASDRIFTIPLNSSVAYVIGTVIFVERTTTGGLTIAATGGVTLTSTSGVLTVGDASTTTGAYAFLVKTATDTWKLYNGSPPLTWTALTPTLLTGFASTTTNDVTYIIEGKRCNIRGTIVGTGNTLLICTITNLPAVCRAVTSKPILVLNNATQQTGLMAINFGTSTATFYATAAGGNFTSSVARALYFELTYEIL